MIVVVDNRLLKQFGSYSNLIRDTISKISERLKDNISNIFPKYSPIIDFLIEAGISNINIDVVYWRDIKIKDGKADLPERPILILSDEISAPLIKILNPRMVVVFFDEVKEAISQIIDEHGLKDIRIVKVSIPKGG